MDLGDQRVASGNTHQVKDRFCNKDVIMEYYSQSGQDKLIQRLFFPNVRNGVFFECGALDGVNISNTYIFEKYFGWTGLLVEPLPREYEQLVRNRPNSRCINACLGKDEAEVFFVNCDAMSGIVKEVGRDHLTRLEREYRNNKTAVRFSWMPVLNTTQVIVGAGFNHVNYFSLDVEGGELSVLSGLDLDQVAVDVFTIERNRHSEEGVNQLLRKFNYIELAHLGQDAIYVRTDFIKQKLRSPEFRSTLEAMDLPDFYLKANLAQIFGAG